LFRPSTTAFVARAWLRCHTCAKLSFARLSGLPRRSRRSRDALQFLIDEKDSRRWVYRRRVGVGALLGESQAADAARGARDQAACRSRCCADALVSAKGVVRAAEPGKRLGGF
jgi:hypothetical protein